MTTTTKTTITRTGFGCGISLEDYFAARNASSSSLGSASTQHTGLANEFTVLPPFDEAAQYADLVLRSSDGVEFRVVKCILALASPVFNDMTTLAKPVVDATSPTSVSSSCSSTRLHIREGAGMGKEDSASKDGLPIVTMFESTAPVLDTLLRLIYPVRLPKLEDFDLLASVLVAAQKYDMELVFHKVEEYLSNIVLGQDNPVLERDWRDREEKGKRRALEIYALACEYRLLSLANLAAREYLKRPDDNYGEYFSVLDRIPGGAMYKLFTYQKRVSEEVDRAVFEPGDSSSSSLTAWHTFVREFECPLKVLKPKECCGIEKRGHKLSKWWFTLRETARCEIQRAPLSDDVVNCGILARAITESKCCEGCRKLFFGNLDGFARLIRERVGIAADLVELQRPW